MLKISDSDAIGLAIQIIKSELSKEELFEIIENCGPENGLNELVFLAAANEKLLESDLFNFYDKIESKFLNEIPSIYGSKKIWLAGGIACNKNLPENIKKDLINQNNPFALVRFHHEFTPDQLSSMPIHQDPSVRQYLGQEDSYNQLLNEARNRANGSVKLSELFCLNIFDYQDQSPHELLGDFVWYEDVNERVIFSNNQDFRVAELLGSSNILRDINNFLKEGEGKLYFNYLQSYILSNPNAEISLDELRQIEPTLCMYWHDVLRGGINKSLEFFLSSLTFDGDSFEINVRLWLGVYSHIMNGDTDISTIKSFEDSLSSEELLSNEAFLNEDDPMFIEVEMNEFDDFVLKTMPYLAAPNSDFLKDSFKLDSLVIKQAILCNPNCTNNIRKRAKKIPELRIPEPMQMALFSAQAGKYELIRNWLTDEGELDLLVTLCGIIHCSDEVRSYLESN